MFAVAVRPRPARAVRGPATFLRSLRSRWCACLLAAFAQLLCAHAAPAQQEPDAGSTFTAPAESATVSMWGHEIVVLRASFGRLTVQDRARLATEQVRNIPAGESEYRVEAVRGTEGTITGAWIKVNDRRLFGVVDADVDPASNQSFDQYADNVVANLRSWLATREDQFRWRHLVRATLLSVLATVAFAAALWAMLFYSRRWLLRRERAANDATRELKISNLNVRPYVITFEVGVYKIVLWAIGFVLAYVWLAFVLNEFPYTRAWGSRLSGYLFGVVENLGLGILGAIPNLFTVVVILLLARLLSRVVGAFFFSAERGLIDSPWLEPETARATRRLVVVLIWIFALIAAYPYIPGSETAAFKGVGVFLGLMVSLGSAGMVGQVVGGLVVVYTRAFRTGDHVTVGEYEGIVREVGVLSTKLETRTRDEVTIPNAVLLAATTVNHSRLARQQGGALVTTKVTIGYDAPWRQVHAMLELAASRTAQIKQAPAPRVLQKTLSDFYPEYVLVFAIERSEDRYMVLSELHAHIQDVFNENGVQIMSPNFEAQPDAPVLSKPDAWFSPPAKRSDSAPQRR